MGVNDNIRKDIKKALIDSGRSQKEVAEKLGIKPQYLSEMLNTKKSGVPKRWLELLSELGLELYVGKRANNADGEV